MTAARIRAQFPTSDGFGYQLKGCCRPPFVWASYNISRYIGRHSSRENNVPYCSHYSSSNTVPIIQFLTHVQLLFTWNLSPLQSSKFSVSSATLRRGNARSESLTKGSLSDDSDSTLGSFRVRLDLGLRVSHHSQPRREATRPRSSKKERTIIFPLSIQ